FFFFQAEDGIRDFHVTGVQTCALPILAFIVIVIDQISKIYIKTHFKINEYIKVLGYDWFQIHFIENDGMAWGVEIPGDYGKLIRSEERRVGKECRYRDEVRR